MVGPVEGKDLVKKIMNCAAITKRFQLGLVKDSCFYFLEVIHLRKDINYGLTWFYNAIELCCYLKLLSKICYVVPLKPTYPK